MTTTRIGLISDTHGLLRPQAIDFLRGCAHIVHGGDIGTPEVLAQLEEIAPVTAVRGNNDRADWATHIPETEYLQIGDVFLYAIHDLALIDIDPAGAGVQVVMSGHTHQPLIEQRGGVLFVNPGSAGPRRFRLPICAGELIVDGKNVSARIEHFDIPTP
ncbi:metallophosphoesterase family protein [Variovorax dokdonensis]|uniref:Phosphoesterase n=1 Tax=Variovorax dokdonensis TaxID=344883 RepID=A0ABT7NFX5_9BURK|nr:metallophosphoesterase family protein [Variovorax dokdonensis]MDM0046841.1 metallophosphoesterase family protein [Variovorax dokdonensis]